MPGHAAGCGFPVEHQDPPRAGPAQFDRGGQARGAGPGNEYVHLHAGFPVLILRGLILPVLVSRAASKPDTVAAQ